MIRGRGEDRVWEEARKGKSVAYLHVCSSCVVQESEVKRD